MGESRIKTRCPSCGNDTLIVDDARNLVCSLIGCERPTMIGDVVAEIANLRKCIAATDRQRDEAIEAHASACARANDMQVENVKQHAEITRLKAEAAKDADLVQRLANALNQFDYDGGGKFLATFGLRKVGKTWRREQ